jgi:hypothetical protein
MISYRSRIGNIAARTLHQTRLAYIYLTRTDKPDFSNQGIAARQANAMYDSRNKNKYNERQEDSKRNYPRSD